MAQPEQMGLHDGLEAAHSLALSHWDKIQESDKMLSQVRTQLDGLVQLGDTVSSDDVVKSAGQLVGAGLDPVKMAAPVKLTGPAAKRGLRALVRVHGLPSPRNSLASINENKSMWRLAIEDSGATCCSRIYESRKQRRFTGSLCANRYETLEGNYLLSRRWENNQAYSSGFA